MTLNNIGEVLLNTGQIVHLETECKDCFSILASEQEISQVVFFFGALEYWTIPMGKQCCSVSAKYLALPSTSWTKECFPYISVG